MFHHSRFSSPPTETSISTHSLPVFSDEPKLITVSATAGTSESKASGAATASLLETAEPRAVAEALERLAWLSPPESSANSPSKEISARNLDCTRIFSLRSPVEKCAEAPLEVTFELDTHAAVLVPRGLVYSTPPTPWRPNDTTGLAAAPDVASAVTAGLLEVVERAAFTRSLLSDDWGCRRDTSALGAMKPTLDRYRLEPILVELPTVLANVSTCLLSLVDSSGVGPCFTCGLAARPSFAEAASHALEEAIQIRTWIRRTAAVDQNHSSQLDQTFRRAAYWSLPDTGGIVANTLRRLNLATPPPEVSSPSFDLNQAIGELRDLEATPLVAPLRVYTAFDLEIYVVRVIVPELEPLLHSPESFPHDVEVRDHFFI